MATRSLSPNRVVQKLREHRQAVAVLALIRAKKIVQAQIRAKGQRISDYSNRQINHLAEDYLAQHGETLRAEAMQTIATSPAFTRWRLPCAQFTTNAQKESEPISTTSSVQMLGAK